jgi:hypothetical protein
MISAPLRIAYRCLRVRLYALLGVRRVEVWLSITDKKLKLSQFLEVFL